MFEYYNTKVQLDKKSLGTLNNCTYFKDYNCESEPEMINDTNKSVNQIKLLTEFGPRFSYFSPDKIKVGVFVWNKIKINYLDLSIILFMEQNRFQKRLFRNLDDLNPYLARK